MGEIQKALKLLGKLPANVLIKNPAGSWSFVGSVDIRLSYVMKDGSAVDEETARKIASFGAGFCNVKRLTWATREDAAAAAAALGLEVR